MAVSDRRKLMKREQKGAWLAVARLTALGLAVALAGSALGQASKPTGGQCDWGNASADPVVKPQLGLNSSNVGIFNGPNTTSIDGTNTGNRSTVTFHKPTCSGSGLPFPSGTAPEWTYTLRDANGDIVTTSDELLGTGTSAGGITYSVNSTTFDVTLTQSSPQQQHWGEAPVKYTIYADWSNAASDDDHVPISYAFKITSVGSAHDIPSDVHVIAESATSIYVEWQGDGSTRVLDDLTTPDTDESVAETSATHYEIVATTAKTKTCTMDKVEMIQPDRVVLQHTDSTATSYQPNDRQGATLKGLCPNKEYTVKVTAISGKASDYSQIRSPASAASTPATVTTKPLVATDPDTKRFLLSTGETVDLDLKEFLEPSLGLLGTHGLTADSTTNTATEANAERYGVDFKFESNLKFDGSVVAGALVDDDDMTYANDIVRLEGAGEGRWTLVLTLTLMKKTTATETSDVVPMMETMTASLPITVLKNAAPVFKMSEATVDWDIDNVGTDFQINVLADFVKDPVTDDDAGDCTDDNQNASNDINCEHSLKFKFTGASVLEITDDNESTGIITVRKKGDGSYVDLTSVEDGHQYELTVTATDDNGAKDTMTIFVDIIEGNDDPIKKDKATDVWLKPQAEANGGGSDSVGLGSKFSDIENDDLCYQISGTSLTGTTSGGESVTFAEASLAGASACPTDRLTMSMILPSTDPKQENAFKLLGRYGTETVWAEVRAWQRGASPRKYTGSVRVSMELSYGPNASPTIRTVAKATKKNAHHEAGAYVTSGTYEIDEGQDITLTFTADDPQPSGDELCWSSWGSCRPCMGEEDTKRNTKGEITTPRRSSTKATMGAVSQEWEMTIVGTKVVRDFWTGKTKTTVFTDYESRGGVYRLSICATDLAGETDVLSFNVKINDVEEAPTIDDIDDVYTVIGDYAVEINVASKTKDGDKDETLTYAANKIGVCQGFTYDWPRDGILRLIPSQNPLSPADENDTEVCEMEVSATDSTGLVAYKRFDVTVKDVNTAPMFANDITSVKFQVPENRGVGKNIGAQLKVEDPDEGDTLAVKVAGSDMFSASIAKNNNNTPDDADDDYMAVQLKVKKTGLNFEANINSYDLMLIVEDKYGGSDEIDVRIDLTDVNERPEKTKDDMDDQRILDGITRCPIMASDHFSDPDARDKQAGLDIDVSSTRPANVEPSVKDADAICITGVSVGSGPARIKVTATDRDDLSVSKSFLVTVEKNNAPTVVGDGLPDSTIQEGGRTEDDINLNDHFDDGDGAYAEDMTYAVSVMEEGDIASAVLVADGSMLRVYGDGKGFAEVTVTATDQKGQSVSDTFEIQVIRNYEPMANADALGSVDQWIGKVYELIDATRVFTDEGDELTYAITTDNPDVATTALDYDDDGDPWIIVNMHSPGETMVTLTATDTAAQVATASFNLMIHERNDAPVLLMPIGDMELIELRSMDISLDGVFGDENLDELEIKVVNEDETIADVVHRINDNLIRIYANEYSEGRDKTLVVVTASDDFPQGAQKTSNSFTITVLKNHAPVVANPVGMQWVYVTRSIEISIADVFSDANEDPLVLEISSANEEIATVERDGDMITITGHMIGSTSFSITATDPGGLWVQELFDFEVRSDSPFVVEGMEIPDQMLTVVDPVMLSVEAAFGDPEDEELTYVTESGDEGVATAMMDGADLTITGVKVGKTMFTVIASDPYGNSASDTFDVTVINAGPMVVSGNEIPDQMLTVVEPITVSFGDTFSDPDGDELSYKASSSDEGVAVVGMYASEDDHMASSIPFSHPDEDAMLVITGVKVGMTTVTVTAMDPEGLMAMNSFKVEVVNAAPMGCGRQRDCRSDLDGC